MIAGYQTRRERQYEDMAVQAAWICSHVVGKVVTPDRLLGKKRHRTSDLPNTMQESMLQRRWDQMREH